MKKPGILQIGLFATVVSILAYCKPADPAPETVVQRQDTLSIAQLRLFHDNPIPSSIRITDVGREGIFTLDQADMSSPDNMGTVLVTSKGHRYKRTYAGSASAYWFGIDVNDTDIGPKLQTAVNAVNDLTIPDGTYTQTTPVHLKSNLALRANPGKVLIKLPKSYISLVNPDDPKIPLSDILIDGLSWISSSQENGRYGTIYIDGPTITNLTIQNCIGNDAAAKDSTNWLTVKIQANRTGTNIVVRNNTVQSKRMACEIFNHDNYGVYAGKNITVSANKFSNCLFGISLSGPLQQLTVDNNYLKNCSKFGIEIAGAAQDVKITNNQFEGVFDKFLTGSNDGSGPDKNGGTVVGGMLITGNSTVGTVTGGIQMFNGGAMQFNKNIISMTGMLELAHSTAGCLFSDNVIESTTANKAVICDDSPNNTFTRNTISNKNSPDNQATFMAYGSKAINNVLTNNKLIKGTGGKPYDAVLGGSFKASMNYDEAGNLLP